MALRSPARAAAHAPTPAHAEDNILRFDDAPEFMANVLPDPPNEDMDMQVKEAQQRLAALRAQQEEVERQKQMLETLRHKQERFISGKRDVVEKLERTLRAVNEDLEEARRRAEDLVLTQKDFQEHLADLRTFLPERWQRGQLDQELDRALGALNDAEVCYEKGLRRMAAHRASDTTTAFHASTAEESDLAPNASFMGDSDEWITWLRRGFAFTLPLIITAIVGMVLARLLF